MTLFGVDVASYQGRVNWSAVFSSGVRFAFSKVSQSTNYVNPTWSDNKPGMKALGDEFLPGAYHFLTSGTDPKAQARYFHTRAGNMGEYAVALDVEPTEGSRPTAAQAKLWVEEYKRLTGGHPVIGYFPGWYWQELGQPGLSFFDTLWQSHYVNGSGTPTALFKNVPSTWWATYGGESVSLLQYSSSANVSGILGQCDINAFRGTLQELRAIALGDDVALTAQDLEKIRQIVWEKDLMPAPAGTDVVKNPKWRPDNVSRETYTATQNILAAVAELAKRDPDMDEAAIVAGVIAGLSPETLADAISTHLGPDVAASVMDALHARLET